MDNRTEPVEFTNCGRVDFGNLANVAPFLLVEVVGLEDTAQGPSGNTKLVELLGELEVLFEEQLAGNAQSLRVGDANALMKLRLDAGLLKQAVQLRTCAMDYHRIESQLVEEQQAAGEVVEMIRLITIHQPLNNDVVSSLDKLTRMAPPTFNTQKFCAELNSLSHCCDSRFCKVLATDVGAGM